MSFSVFVSYLPRRLLSSPQFLVLELLQPVHKLHIFYTQPMEAPSGKILEAALVPLSSLSVMKYMCSDIKIYDYKVIDHA